MRSASAHSSESSSEGSLETDMHHAQAPSTPSTRALAPFPSGTGAIQTGVLPELPSTALQPTALPRDQVTFAGQQTSTSVSTAESNAHTAPSSEDASIWRDSALRYGGYADEIGEFAHPYLGGFGKFVGYGLSTLYVVGDMGSTLVKKIRNHKDDPTSRTETVGKIGLDMLDLGIFHTVATLLIPPQIIGTVVDIADKVLDPVAKAHHAGGGWIERTIVNPTVNFLRPKIQPLFQKHYFDALAPRLEARYGAAANQALANHAPKIASMSRPIANLADKYNAFAKFTRILPTTDPLHGQLDDLLTKAKGKGFSPSELARLTLVKPLPVLLGVAMVPLIAHPFDQAMLKVQDWTTRLLFGKNKLVREDGKLKSVPNPNYWPAKAHKQHHPFFAASSFTSSISAPPNASTAIQRPDTFQAMFAQAAPPPGQASPGV